MDDVPIWSYFYTLTVSDGLNTSTTAQTKLIVTDVNSLSGGGGQKVIIPQDQQQVAGSGQPLSAGGGTIGQTIGNVLQNFLTWFKSLFN